MKTILDLCGGTGAWSKPYRDAGYNVELITLPKYDVTEFYFDEFCLNFPYKNHVTRDYKNIFPKDVYGILAAPPCTEFSLAKADLPRDLKTALEIVNACMNIIQTCALHGNLKFWALENPIGLLRKFIGTPRFSFEQWMYGDEGIKPTDIWGYFNIPKQIIQERPANLLYKRNGRGYTKNMDNPKQNTGQLKMTMPELRAITPAGFANAFFKANK
jgi:site-specific DNA-cytosine methylase